MIFLIALKKRQNFVKSSPKTANQNLVFKSVPNLFLLPFWKVDWGTQEGVYRGKTCLITKIFVKIDERYCWQNAWTKLSNWYRWLDRYKFSSRRLFDLFRHASLLLFFFCSANDNIWTFWCAQSTVQFLTIIYLILFWKVAVVYGATQIE